ncbi:NUDIX hydrolase [Deinococcus cellulosilyticus]|uniref:ADP-ribose pyrophosphatase n=1 Tax=Deinococcus cellulosilyticus (strain DSM 18568 / NBRC 106333 / KACC 11606 / 5516J-15) TaxID=1223518 RepID=A0A511MWM7_DEIC1|nr:NUDIX hydrolase [Deinococcus cellulosilyticus]GEM44979.1 ADP-ribose pyrophosphatase [Deinococcus cellulosilyticus NBRC 106333 = KACC 11606]
MSQLQWAREILSLAQAGLAYSNNVFDTQRYQRLQELAAEMLAPFTDRPAQELASFLKAEEGYPTPKIDVRAIVFQDNQILLVRERSDGGWTPPGGWADMGESPSEMAVRETREEAGYEVRAVKLLAVHDRNRHNHPHSIWETYKIFILCELTGGSAQTSIETSDVGFFGEDELPALSTERISEQQIRRMFEHLRNPSWPADFD